MNAKKAQMIMDRKFGWRPCTMTERLIGMVARELPTNVYKILRVYRTGRGITFFLWFSDDEIIEVMVNGYACDAYDVSDIHMELINSYEMV